MDRIEGQEGVEKHTDSLLAEIAKLENERINGEVQPEGTLDFSGRHPDSPWHETNELKLILASDKLAELMREMLRDDGVTDNARLRIFQESAKEYLGRRTFMRNHLGELYLQAKAGNTEFVKKALEQIYANLKTSFLGEFKKPMLSKPEAKPTRRGMELDDATRRQLGPVQADWGNLHGTHEAYGKSKRIVEVQKRKRGSA